MSTDNLAARGEPTVYCKSRNELRYIGMPVGGIGCGLLYLGGDGKLWLWDIFNDNKEGVLPGTVELPLVLWQGNSTIGAREGRAYVAPHEQTSPVTQGVVLELGDERRSLDATGWDEVTFCGQYPLGTVTYTDPQCPLAVTLEAFSPFIPLNLADSSLPATVLAYTLTNVSPIPHTARLIGYLENPAPEKGTMALGCDTKGEQTLLPGQSVTITFVVAWHFPQSSLKTLEAETGNHYATQFSDANAVVAYVLAHQERLTRETKLWRATFYDDSTLPHWFLERTIANVSTLATTTFHRFGSGRFWAWEGIGCCPGTCTHVWHYAQAPGRLFPELERDLRERVDFGVSFEDETGIIGYRGEKTGAAVDGQCGRILGVLREHQLSPDGAFLERLWPRVKLALEFLMRHDHDSDGLLDGAQENTLDAAWFGKIAWLSSLYAAALRAGEVLARESGDLAFATLCGQRAAQTQQAIETELFNGEYFIQKPEPGREGALGTYQTCHIDQVHGQSWAWQVGLPRVLDREKTVTALKALYRHNFTHDVGPFRLKNRPGRPYALPGDGGLIMATNPKELPDAFGDVQAWQYGYFNECMSGFEHQAASHMIAEGLVSEGLTVTRAIHDRYHARLRNPFNEVECSDHYARAMASYGSYITLCGFTSHGPSGQLAFAPRLPGDFQCAFTAAEGWGTFRLTENRATLTVKWGRVRVNTLGLPVASKAVRVFVDGVPVTASLNGQSVVIEGGAVLEAGSVLQVELLTNAPPVTRIPVTQNRDYAIYDWQTRHAAVLARNKTTKPELVFLGDSITHYFAGEPLAPIARGPEAWQTLCGNHSALNLGYGWDRIENVLWRVENGELAGIAPKVITVLIGTNNIGHNTDDAIVDGLRELLQTIRSHQPKAKLLVLGILPRRDALERVAALNAQLAPMVEAHADAFLDIDSAFLDSSGTVPTTLMEDGLHPTGEGYARLAEAVAPMLSRLLG